MILSYSNKIKMDYSQIVGDINDTFLTLVLGTMVNKSEFQNIFNELKKQFKESNTAQTKEIIIVWFTELFKAFQEELIDRQTDVFEELINSLNFHE